jgi:hypothetical protein
LSFGFFGLNREKNEQFRRPPNRQGFLEIFSVCFGLFQEYSVFFGCFDSDPKHRNKPKQKKMYFGFEKQTKKQPKQIEFRFVSVRTEKKFDCFKATLLIHPAD